MSRYLGSVCKLCRREQTKLFLKGEKCLTKCVLEKRPQTPGMAKPQRSKPSEFAIRLREKQKLRRMIFMNEKPFEQLVGKASKAAEASGDHLLRSIQMRLDNIVRQLGLATSIKAARQLVSHGHVKIAGRMVNIPSYLVKPGDLVSFDPRLRENVAVKLSLETAGKRNMRPAFLEFNENEFSGKILRQPERAESTFPVTEQLIIEHYSK